MHGDRREFQRLQLDPPVPGTLGATAVSILDVGVLGARVHHAGSLEGGYAELRFSHGQSEVAMKCEVVRTRETASKYPGAGFESGVRFVAAIGESGDRLRRMLGDLVQREFAQRQRLPIKAAADPVIDGDKTVRGIDAQFVSYRVENGIWHRRRVFLPEQPANGFTVVSAENDDEMARLCAVYSVSDTEGQRLIRLFAELSVSDALQIPPVAQ